MKGSRGDPDVKDAWGLPAQKVWTDATDLSLLPHNHLMGTCRMGDDPKTSVVDRYHRPHDVPDLFLVDGSLVTACYQPTCTIQALAFRAADHIAGQARKAAI